MIRPTRAHHPSWLLIAVLIAWLPGEVRSDGSEVRAHACGTVALCLLLKVEGHDVRLDQVERTLDARGRREHSMAELRDAARRLGLRLSGIKLNVQGDLAPNCPAIVYLRRGDVGHFIVVRPVGHTGKLVQLIDNTHEPEVMDASELYSSREWTGLALVPARTSPVALAIGGGGAVLGAILLVSHWRRRRSRTGLPIAMIPDSAGR